MLGKQPKILSPEERDWLLLIGKIQIVSTFLDSIHSLFRIVGGGEVFQPTNLAMEIIVGGFRLGFGFDFGDNLLQMSVFAGADSETEHTVASGHPVCLTTHAELDKRSYAKVFPLHISLVQRHHEVSDALRSGEWGNGVPGFGGVRSFARQHDIAADYGTSKTARFADDSTEFLPRNVVQGVGTVD